MTGLPAVVRLSERLEKRERDDRRRRLASARAYQLPDGTLQICDGVDRWIATKDTVEVRR